MKVDYYKVESFLSSWYMNETLMLRLFRRSLTGQVNKQKIKRMFCACLRNSFSVGCSWTRMDTGMMPPVLDRSGVMDGTLERRPFFLDRAASVWRMTQVVERQVFLKAFF